MRGRSVQKLVLFIIASLLILFPAVAGYAQVVWFGPVDPVAKYGAKKGESDFMNLFSDPAAWRQALQRVKVIKFYTEFIDQARDDQLSTIFQFLRQHNIALAIDTWFLHSGPSGCGHGEGYLPNSELPTRIVQRIKRLGGNLAYVSIDESFGANRAAAGCHLSSAEAAKDAASTFAIYRNAFPNVQIGDIENLPVGNNPRWFSDYAQWADSFKKAAATPFAFFQMDVDWNSPTWQFSISAFNRLLSQRGIPFGVIFNGSAGAKSDTAWIASAEQNIARYRAARLPQPSQAVFQTWDQYPSRVLPETSPTSLTYLVGYYFNAMGSQ
jgi:hypothetical protein